MVRFGRSVAVAFAVLRAGLALAAGLPPGVGLALGRLAGLLFYAASPHRRRRTVKNLRMALGLDAARARRLARRNCAYLGEITFENLLLLGRGPAPLLRHIEVRGREHIERVRAQGRGAIFVTGHLGNWELGGLLTAHLWGRLTSAAELPSNALLRALLLRFRSQAGQRIVPRKGGLALLLRALRTGGAVGLVIDTDARRHGIVAPFFGLPASTTPTPARLALLTGAPIVPGVMWRRGPLRYVATYLPPVRPDARLERRAAVAECTRRLNDLLEAAVRRAPEQWTWLHGRWKTGLRWCREMGPDAPYGLKAGHWDD